MIVLKQNIWRFRLKILNHRGWLGVHIGPYLIAHERGYPGVSQRIRRWIGETYQTSRRVFWHCLPFVRHVNVYDVDRRYGGPEEGGWWYDAYCCVRSIPVPWFLARKIADRLQPLCPDAGRITGGNPDDLDSDEDFEPNDMTGVTTGEDIRVYAESLPAESESFGRPEYC